MIELFFSEAPYFHDNRENVQFEKMLVIFNQCSLYILQHDDQSMCPFYFLKCIHIHRLIYQSINYF